MIKLSAFRPNTRRIRHASDGASNSNNVENARNTHKVLMHTSPEALIGRTANLVSLPDIYLRVKGVMEDPETSMADLTAVASRVPSETSTKRSFSESSP